MINPLRLTFDGPIATLTMDDGRGNAINPGFLDAMDRALTEAESARVLILHGRPTLFSGGLDVPVLSKFSRADFATFVQHFDETHARLLSYPRPIVTCARGGAIAGGAVLLCAGDVRLVAPTAKVGVNEVALGLNFPIAAFEIVRVAVGDHRMADTVTSGRIYVGNDCLRTGFATELVPADEQEARARTIAAEYLSTDPEAVALVREQTRRASVERIRAHAAADRAHFVTRWFAPETQARRDALVSRLASR